MKFSTERSTTEGFILSWLGSQFQVGSSYLTTATGVDLCFISRTGPHAHTRGVWTTVGLFIFHCVSKVITVTDGHSAPERSGYFFTRLLCTAAIYYSLGERKWKPCNKCPSGKVSLSDSFCLRKHCNTWAYTVFGFHSKASKIASNCRDQSPHNFAPAAQCGPYWWPSWCSASYSRSRSPLFSYWNGNAKDDKELGSFSTYKQNGPTRRCWPLKARKGILKGPSFHFHILRPKWRG